MANIDISGLVTYTGEHLDELFSTLIDGMDVKNDVTVLEGVEGKTPMTKLTIADGFKPYSEAHAPIASAATYTDRTLEVNTGKYDFTLNPEDYLKSWLGAKRQGNAHDIPFEQYTMEQFMKRVAEQINNDAAYLGSYNASGTTAAATATGYGTKIAAAITATDLTAVATGALSDTNTVEKVEDMYEAADAPYQNVPCYVYCSKATEIKYLRDRRTRYGGNMNYNGDPIRWHDIEISGGVWKLKPVSWMGTSSRLIATPQENLIMGINTVSDDPEIYLDPELDFLKGRIKFTFGFEIRDLSAIWVNDQA